MKVKPKLSKNLTSGSVNVYTSSVDIIQKDHVPTSAPSPDSDAGLLAQIGYKQELRRKFNAIQVFGVAFSIMGVFPSIASMISTGLIAGPAGLIWGWVIAASFIMTIGIGMGENVSSQPTSGGLYYWTNYYAPPALKTVFSFVIGNTNSLALVTALCSVNYGFATLILSIVALAHDQQFELAPTKTYGVFVVGVLLQVALTCASSNHCVWIQTTSIIVNVVLILLFTIAMPIVASRGDPRPASWVFTKFESISDYPMEWVQISQAWMPAIWTTGGFDACVHMAEECNDPSRTIPFGIISSIGVCAVTGLVIMIVAMFSLQTYDIEGRIINSKLGLPMAQIIFDAFQTVPGQGKKMAIFFMVLISIGQFMIGASVLTAISRQIFAFARDNGLPFSWWNKKVSERHAIPVHAIITGGALAIIIGLLSLIGTTAANALFTLVIAGNYFAWGFPNLLRLLYMEQKFVPGKFFVGEFWSRANGWVSVGFGCYTIVMVMFPMGTHPNKETMNYTVVVTLGVWVLSLVYYYAYAHKTYHGPVSNLDEIIDQTSESDSHVVI